MTVKFAIDDKNVAQVTLSRPECANAFNQSRRPQFTGS